METRAQQEVKVYSLHLNPMTANFEKANMVAASFNREDLMKWYEGLKVEPYQDERWHKTFKKGSKLEWYNPIEWSDHCGVDEQWVTMDAIKNYINQARSSMGFVEVPELINIEI